MRTAITAGIVAGLLLLAACGKSEAEMQADCQKALGPTSTKTDRPDACKELSQDDYDTLLTHWAVSHVLDGMSQDDKDILDLYDDGEVNGSIGG